MGESLTGLLKARCQGEIHPNAGILAHSLIPYVRGSTWKLSHAIAFWQEAKAEGGSYVVEIARTA